jgi:DNA-directed RNA polymerase specialized sigma24 family protein
MTPQLLALPVHYQLVAAYIDAHLWNCWAIYATAALVAEIQGSEESEGWNEDQTKRTMRERWGARDQYGVYSAAGLTKAETEVAFLRFDRQLTPSEIGRLLGRSAVTVRVQLHNAQQRLRKLAWTEAAKEAA